MFLGNLGISVIFGFVLILSVGISIDKSIIRDMIYVVIVVGVKFFWGCNFG